MKNKHIYIILRFKVFWRDYNILNESLLLLLLYYVITAVFIKTFKYV